MPRGAPALGCSCRPCCRRRCCRSAARRRRSRRMRLPAAFRPAAARLLRFRLPRRAVVPACSRPACPPSTPFLSRPGASSPPGSGATGRQRRCWATWIPPATCRCGRPSPRISAPRAAWPAWRQRCWSRQARSRGSPLRHGFCSTPATKPGSRTPPMSAAAAHWRRMAQGWPVPVDAEGLDVAAGAAAAPHARLALVTPSHQYPLGGTMSLRRRLALLDWAERKGAWVVDDDYDGDFRYTGRPLQPLRALPRPGAARVVLSGPSPRCSRPGCASATSWCRGRWPGPSPRRAPWPTPLGRSGAGDPGCVHRRGAPRTASAAHARALRRTAGRAARRAGR